MYDGNTCGRYVTQMHIHSVCFQDRLFDLYFCRGTSAPKIKTVKHPCKHSLRMCFDPQFKPLQLETADGRVVTLKRYASPFVVAD